MECATRAALPVSSIIERIFCDGARVLIVETDSLSGKSTLDDIIPQWHEVLCVQPRKAAMRVAGETSPLGRECRMNDPTLDDGLKPKCSVKIHFVTEKRFLDYALRNHHLASFDCIILDEVHGRTVSTDICLGVMKRVLRVRKDMKLVICSATRDSEPILNYFAEFGAQPLEILGRQFPIQICYEPAESHCHGSGILSLDHVSWTVDKVIRICQNEAKKKAYDEEVTWEDGAEMRAAHVVAFLATPLETYEAEKCLRSRLEKLKHGVRVKIITLFGCMPWEEQEEVLDALEPGYHHKVILTTDVAATSATVPSGVRYVVDCGLAKVKKLDVLGLISKGAAKQRAGIAGRTAPGICYRLFSEQQYERTESTNVPDLLVANLAETVLFMIASGFKYPVAFDFINKPDVDLLVQAQDLLKSLDAIKYLGDVPVLTQVGKEMKKLPLEPHLAKMVLDSMECDLVAESAVICACIQVGSIFERDRKQDQLILSDQRKLTFCDDSGDPMTFLRVFWQYMKMPKGQLMQWCYKNYVNLECMKTVYDLAAKICSIISERGEAINTNLKEIDVAKARKHLPNLFCRAYVTNVAIYSGIPERGYFDFKHNKYVFIHPSSALTYNDITPEFIVYECLVPTPPDSVMNVCAADPAWLDGIDQNVLKEKKEDKLVPYNVCFGPTVKRWIVTHMEDLRQKVGRECIAKMSDSDPYYRLQVYVAVKNLAKLEAFVEQNAEKKLGVICKKAGEVPVMQADYVLHMSGSGAAVELLMSGEFCSMFVGRAGINWASDKKYRDQLEKYFSRFGQITEFVTFDEELQNTTGHACLIRMENKKVAQSAFTFYNESDLDLNIKPRLGQNFLGRAGVGSHHPRVFRLRVTWYRRPSSGYGHVKLKSHDLNDRLYAFSVLSKHLKQFRPSVNPSDLTRKGSKKSADELRKITLHSLPLAVDSNRLREIVSPLLDLYGIQYEDIYVLRKSSYPVEEEKVLEEHSERITKYIVRVAKKANITLVPFLNSAELKESSSVAYPFEVKIRPPERSNDINFTAFVLFNDMKLGMRVGDALEREAENGSFLEMGPLNQFHKASIQQIFHYQMEAPKFLFDAIHDDLKGIHGTVDHEYIDFDYCVGTNGSVYLIYISGGNFNAVNELKAAVEKVIDGFTFSCRDGAKVDGEELPCYRLLTRAGCNYLYDLSRRREVFLNISPFKMEVKIQGSLSNVEMTKTEIKQFLLQWSGADVKQVIHLQPPRYRQGTLKALLAQNYYNLHWLEERLGHGVHLDVNIAGRELRFVGKESEYEQLLTILRDISDSIQLASTSETDAKGSETPKCVVCLCAADPDNYCLEACGHYVCKSCMNLQLKASAEMREFPITCAACERPLTWCDLEALLCGDQGRNKEDDPQRLQPLADASLACFIQRHGHLYKYCATPDCRGLHPVTKEAALGHCKLCGRIQCTRCGREDHESVTCEQYAVLRVDADESVRKWIRENQKNRRICPNPNCQAVIEKLGGCDHVECNQCKVHFCWICMFTAKESKVIYAHMDAKHGGSGADVRELFMEMENDPFLHEFIEREHPELIGEDFGRRPHIAHVILDDDDDDDDYDDFDEFLPIPD